MAQLGYPGHDVMCGTPNVATPHHYAIPPEQNAFLSPTQEYACQQQWPGWDNIHHHMTEPMYVQGHSTGFTGSAQWETEGHGRPAPDGSGPMADYTTATWAPQSDEWPSYQQQHFQQPKPGAFNSPAQRPTPACSPPFMGPAWQSPLASQCQPNSGPQSATTTPNKTMNNVKRTSNDRRSSVAQQPPRKTRIGPRAEPSPAGSTSFEEDVIVAAYPDVGEESEAGPSPGDGSSVASAQGTGPGPGLDRNKKYRVKNRAAAKRCREKTKQYEIDLAAREKQVTQERMYLDACVTALKNEVLTLKNQILQHGDCECDMIKGYIAKAAGDVSVGAGRPNNRSRSMA
ncbi:Cyclic AMP-responsive element-binding protein 5 [Colletotrichum chlorophyti]|uniref:Cyclic AMP-responsive element-binding protein 5 n=1 Tax=Colletotrichum chlorophyti TaxID=708187 RepID=A0A1Q8S6Z6_9PEZI|nr:Cyclic AMP-responsive element-binding protein 5 [Colletotrichum chlorophyti]